MQKTAAFFLLALPLFSLYCAEKHNSSTAAQLQLVKTIKIPTCGQNTFDIALHPTKKDMLLVYSKNNCPPEEKCTLQLYNISNDKGRSYKNFMQKHTEGIYKAQWHPTETNILIEYDTKPQQASFSVLGLLSPDPGQLTEVALLEKSSINSCIWSKSGRFYVVDYTQGKLLDYKKNKSIPSGRIGTHHKTMRICGASICLQKS